MSSARPRKSAAQKAALPRPQRATHPVLALQRQAGNKAVAASLQDSGGRNLRLSQLPLVQRFNEPEHKSMGDAGAGGAQIKLPGGLAVSFGDITALAGDYFGSVEQIRALAAVTGDGQSAGTRDEVEYALHVEVRKDKKAADFGPDVAKAVKGRYYALAGTNLRHFTQPNEGDSGRTTDELANERAEVPAKAADAYGVAKGTRIPVTNVGTYRANHERAIEAAARAGAGGAATMDDALLFEAFASHFLTDAFAAGHLRTPRGAISDWWNAKVPMFWTNLKLWMAEVIAKHMNDNSLVAGVLTVQMLYEQAQDTLQKVEKTIPALTFGDVVSGALHDIDNEQGVMAAVGSEALKLVGDGQVIDGRGRELAKGMATAQKAAVSLQASLKEVRDAFRAGVMGADPGSVVQSTRLSDGLFRAEQLWPRALADNDPRQANASIEWQVAGPEQLFANPRMREAFTHFAHEKADMLAGEVKLEAPLRADKMLALKEAVVDRLKGDEATVTNLLRAVINYTPGSATGETGGLFKTDEDDDAVSYYKAAKAKNALDALTLTQRKRLVRMVLEGATVGAEETMIADLLISSPDQATAVLDDVGWHRVWTDTTGDALTRIVKDVGPRYWATKPLALKKAEVRLLSDGWTSAISQQAIVMILKTCSGPEEVRSIDKHVGWPGLEWDLTGSYQDEFDQLRR